MFIYSLTCHPPEDDVSGLDIGVRAACEMLDELKGRELEEIL